MLKLHLIESLSICYTIKFATDTVIPRPFQGRFVVRRLGLATINLYTRYEVSMFTHYEDMKGDEKCKNWGGLGG